VDGRRGAGDHGLSKAEPDRDPSLKPTRKSIARVPTGARSSKHPPPAPPAERLLEGLYVVFQPIVDVTRRRVFAFEALVRNPSFPSPPVLFETALGCGRCGELGREIRRLAVAAASGWPLFLNVHPQEFGEGWIVRPDDPIFLHDSDVYLEITESVPLSHFSLVTPIIRELRAKGARLVVDDLGAGYSNLRYIADLEPEVVKLDRGLIAGCHKDKRQRTLITSLVRLCDDLGARVVAEGIELADELVAIIDTGVQFAQGYLIAKPGVDMPLCSPESMAILELRSDAPPVTARGARGSNGQNLPAPVELGRMRRGTPPVPTRRSSRSFRPNKG
jgi:EAL domain-containing protein (putative c-di-GMP-specific phosphodiesterase class I)